MLQNQKINLLYKLQLEEVLLDDCLGSMELVCLCVCVCVCVCVRIFVFSYSGQRFFLLLCFFFFFFFRFNTLFIAIPITSQ